MRESFGGAFMIKLVLVFIVIYISFMAVAVNYAKAFRVKNQVINILEQYQFDGEDQDVIDAIDLYLSSVPYAYSASDAKNLPLVNHCTKSAKAADSSYYKYTTNGVCIIQKGASNNNKVYYQVITYIAINFPFFNISMTVPISGETKTIVS